MTTTADRTAPDPVAAGARAGRLVRDTDPAHMRRAAGLADHRAMPDAPGRSRRQPFRAQFRHQPVTMNGKALTQLDGYASVVEMEYEMWDMFGPYGETIAAGAFDGTLSRNPDVAFLLNHRGMTMARTRNETLTLDADPRGLHALALVNDARTDVADMLTAIDDGLIDEMSFAFMILDGEWDDTYEHFRILEVDLDRGDVSAVNFGANPFTSIEARAQEWAAEMRQLPDWARRDLVGRVTAAAPAGTSGPDIGVTGFRHYAPAAPAATPAAPPAARTAPAGAPLAPAAPAGAPLAPAASRREPAPAAPPVAPAGPAAPENVNVLIASLGGVLGEAAAITGGLDIDEMPEPVGHALDLLAAAGPLASDIMRLLGLDLYADPDPATGASPDTTARISALLASSASARSAVAAAERAGRTVTGRAPAPAAPAPADPEPASVPAPANDGGRSVEFNQALLDL